MLSLSGFELYSRWVPLTCAFSNDQISSDMTEMMLIE